MRGGALVWTSARRVWGDRHGQRNLLSRFYHGYRVTAAVTGATSRPDEDSDLRLAAGNKMFDISTVRQLCH